jgi:hypothetical protein
MAHPLINAQNVRTQFLKIAKEERPHSGFERIGDSALTAVENNMRTFMRDYVQRHPSVGKTIK